MDGIRIKISPRVLLDVWYARRERVWYGRYIHAEYGYQIGDAWFGATRDEVLVFRPTEPEV